MNVRQGPTSIQSRPTTRPPGAAAWAGFARTVVLVSSDVAALAISGVIAFILWAAGVRGQPAGMYWPFAFAPFLMITAYAQARLYPGFSMGQVEVLRRYTLITTACYGGLATLVFLLKLDNVYSRMTLGLAFLFSIFLVPVLRRLTLWLARKWNWWAEPAVLVVSGASAERLSVLAIDWPDRETKIVEVLGHTAGDVAVDLDQAIAWANAGVRIAIADIDGPPSFTLVDRLRLVFPRVVVLRRMDHLPVEGVQVRNFDGLLGLEYGNNLLRRQSRWVKRAMDILVSAPSIVLAAPFVLVAAVIVKLLSRGPALFFQSREGRMGRTIKVPKIRTMRVGAESEIEHVLEKHPYLRDEWDSAYKLRNDPRIIRGIGPILRRFSIDELPQLLSVLRGEMSLVGPRPFPAYHLDALSDHARHLRAEVRPGITGLWQITARGIADVETNRGTISTTSGIGRSGWTYTSWPARSGQ